MSNPERDFREAIELLHEQALEVIANARTTWFEDISSAYRGALAAFPKVWSRYEKVPIEDIEERGAFFEEGPMDALYQALYSELDAAMRSSSHEIASDAVGRVYGMAADALGVGASSVLDRVLSYLAYAYELGKELKSDIAEDAARRAVALLTQFGQLHLIHVFTDLDDVQAQQEMLPVLRRYFLTLGNLLKTMLDLGDFEGFIDLDHAWGEMLELWVPEHASPQQRDVRRLASRLGENHPDVEELRGRAQPNDERAEMKIGLVRLRTTFRFLLLTWLLRRVNKEGPADPYLKMGERLKLHFPNLASCQKASSIALSQEWFGTRSPLSDWLFAEMRPRGAVHGLSPESPIFRTFAMMALSLISLDSSQRLEPEEWLRLWATELQSVVNALNEDEAEWGVLPVSGSFQESKSKLIELLTSAAAEQEALEEEQLRQAVVSDSLMRQFVGLVQKEWAEARMLPDLFVASTSVPTVQQHPNPPPGRLVTNWLPKEFFVEPVRLGGMESFAGGMGRTLAHDELTRFLDLFEEAPTTSVVRADLSEQISVLVDEFDSDLSLLLLPYDWALLETLGLSPHQDTMAPEGVSVEGARYFAGIYRDEIPAFWLNELEDRILIADTRRFVNWQRFALDEEGNELQVRLRVFSTEEARELAEGQLAKNPEQGITPEERAKTIQERVLAEVRSSDVLELLDSGGARVLVIGD